MISSLDYAPAANYIYFVASDYTEGANSKLARINVQSAVAEELDMPTLGSYIADVRRGANDQLFVSSTQKSKPLVVLDPDEAQTQWSNFGIGELTYQTSTRMSGGLPLQNHRSYSASPCDEKGTFYARHLGKKHYELSDHLGNVRAVVSDLKLSEIVDNTPSNFSAKLEDYTNYYPFGMGMPLRQHQGEGYRYGYQGSEKDNEIKGNGNSYTTYFRQLDPRVGRWLSVDPKSSAAPWESPYASMGNNPVFYNDVLGDIVKGVNATSAQRMESTIKNTFKGEDAEALRNLFTLSADGQTMSSIKEDDFIAATAFLSRDQQALAYGYYSAINSTDMHLVEVVKRAERLSNYTVGEFSKSNIPFTKGHEVNDEWGHANASDPNNPKLSLTIIVMDSKTKVKDNKYPSGFKGWHDPTSAGEGLAHEMLGHGLGNAKGSVTAIHEDAIQMSNLFRRTQGSNIYRNGGHHDQGVNLTMPVATDIPKHIQLPVTFQKAIDEYKSNMIEVQRMKNRHLINTLPEK